MPTKDPALWAILAAWLHEHWPTIYGLLLALSVAWVRITYTGGTGRRRTLETLLIGLLWLGVSGILGLLGVPDTASGFVGCLMGYLGLETIRDLAVKFLERKAEN